MIKVIFVSLVLISANCGYIQYYRNSSKSSLTGIGTYLQPITKKCISLFLLMAVTMFSLGVYLKIMNDQDLMLVLKRLCCLAILWPAAAIDYKEHKIPNRLLLMGMVYRATLFIVELLFYTYNIKQAIVSEFAAVVLVLIISILCRLIVKNGICMGDIKMLMLMALFLGFQSFIDILFVSLWICFFEALILMIMKKKGKKDSIAFAPSVLIGTFVSLVLIRH